MVEVWTSASPEMQTVIAGVFAGIIMYLLQRFWTSNPVIPWLGPDASTAKKRLAAILLAVVGALVVGHGDWQQIIMAFVGALGASQTVHSWAKPGGEKI